MMKKYTAITNASEIIDVIASSLADAMAKIEKALKRPGRYSEYDRWVADGKQVK